MGNIALRDDVEVDGGITADGPIQGTDLEVSDTLVVTERAVDTDGTTAPDLSEEGSGLIYFDRVADKFQVSEDGGAFEELVKTPIRCRVYNSANIAVADNTAVTLTFNSERYDTASMHSTSLDTSKIVIPVAGVYNVGGCVFMPNPGSAMFCRLTLVVNGTNAIALQSAHMNLGAGGLVVNTDYTFAANDYVEILAYQTNAGLSSVNVSAFSSFSPEFWAHRIS